MTIPASGGFSLASVNTELLLPSNTPTSLNDSLVRFLARKQTAGSAISMADLRNHSFSTAFEYGGVPVTGGLNTNNSSVHMSLDGSTVVVNCTSTPVYSDSTWMDGGGALVFYTKDVNGSYVYNTHLLLKRSSQSNTYDTVSISSDGSIVTVCALYESAPPETNRYSFVTAYKSGGTWVLGPKVYGDLIDNPVYSSPDRARPVSCSLSSDGQTLLVCASERDYTNMTVNVGSLSIYSYTGSGTWTRVQKIKPADDSAGNSMPHDYAHLSGDGLTIVSYEYNYGTSPSLGRLRVYTKSGGTFSVASTFQVAYNSGVMAGDTASAYWRIDGMDLAKSSPTIALRLTGYNSSTSTSLYRIAVGTISAGVITLTDKWSVSGNTGTGIVFAERPRLSPNGQRLVYTKRITNPAHQSKLGFYEKNPASGLWLFEGEVDMPVTASASVYAVSSCLSPTGSTGFTIMANNTFYRLWN
jgi:hypothetical protein